MIKSIGGTLPASNDISGESSINELNALQYLRTIEEKGHQLSQQYVEDNSEDEEERTVHTSNYRTRPHSEMAGRQTSVSKQRALSNLKIDAPDLKDFDYVRRL